MFVLKTFVVQQFRPTDLGTDRMGRNVSEPQNDQLGEEFDHRKRRNVLDEHRLNLSSLGLSEPGRRLERRFEEHHR